MTDLGGCINIRKGKPCGRVARIRGLCTACYNLFRHHVKKGKTTEEAEVAAGRLLPQSGLYRGSFSRKIKLP